MNNDEFSGGDLDAGSIIGIAVAVMVLVVIVFLIIFARATGRWCFVGESKKLFNIKLPPPRNLSFLYIYK